MSSSELDRLLRRLHAPRRDPERARHRRDLAGELVAEHEGLPTPKRWTMIKQTPWFRPLLACLCVLVIGAAACNAPTEYEVRMGQHLTLTMDDTASYDQAVDLFTQLEEAVAFVEGRPGVEDVSITVDEIDGGATSVDLMVWGQALDGDALAAAITAEFPALAGAEIAIEPLAGTVAGNLGDALGHALFHIEVSGETAEEIQASILAQLAAQGFTGDAAVDVQQADGFQTIDIELTDTEDEADGAQGAADDVIVIERKAE